MNNAREEVFKIVKEAVDDLNEELEYEALNNVTEKTRIFGDQDGVDSLSLVKLIVGLEAEIQNKFNKNVLLADEKALSMKNSPFRTVGTLVDSIINQIEADDV